MSFVTSPTDEDFEEECKIPRRNMITAPEAKKQVLTLKEQMLSAHMQSIETEIRKAISGCKFMIKYAAPANLKGAIEKKLLELGYATTWNATDQLLIIVWE